MELIKNARESKVYYLVNYSIVKKIIIMIKDYNSHDFKMNKKIYTLWLFFLSLYFYCQLVD